VLNAWLMSAVLWAAMVAWLGAGVLPYLVIQAVVGFSLLEVVNYMEHYGMLRQRVGAPGRRRYERVDPSHSWNSNNIATNVLLYHLQRHSDHHANPTRRYQTLRDFAESPVLPTGYAGMIVLALVPPLWRRVMDPRVLAHYGGDISRANIQPGKRAKVLARHGTRVTAAARELADTRGDATEGGMCPGCGYVYDEQRGDPREGFPAGTPWAAIPDSWCCPDCGVRDKVDFVAPGRVAPAGGGTT
jgi:alkane 1-monooxygenase